MGRSVTSQAFADPGDIALRLHARDPGEPTPADANRPCPGAVGKSMTGTT